MPEGGFLRSRIRNSKVQLIQFLLNRLNIARPFKTDLGSLSPEEDSGLKKLLAEAGNYPGPIVEIGTLIGATTMKMALWSQNKKVITVDSYVWNAWGFSPTEHYDLARHSLYSLVQLGRVEQVRMDKAEFYRSYTGDPPALVFLDAVHTYEETKKDIDWAKEIGTRVIVGHDYSEDWPGVMQAVDEAGGAKELVQSVWRL